MITLTPEHWTELAECARRDPDLWFPEAGSPATAEMARHICAGCPVRDQCHDYAVRTRPEHGIWAGIGARQIREGTPITSRTTEIGRLVEAGLTDTQIADQLGIGRSTAADHRRRLGLKANPPTPPDACGTSAGYQRHRRNGETACRPCLTAHAQKTSHYRSKK